MLLDKNLLFAATFETLLNQALRLDPHSFQAVRKLAGKIVGVSVQGLGLNMTLFPNQEGIAVMGNYDGEMDAHVSGAPFTLLRLLLQTNASLTSRSDISVTGDIGTAQRLLHILSQLDIDWEEHFAQRVGDMPAHWISRLFKRTHHYARGRLHSVQGNISEYLQEERRFVPAPAEMDDFLNAVDVLREDVERLEQRVLRLQRHICPNQAI